MPSNRLTGQISSLVSHAQDFAPPEFSDREKALLSREHASRAESGAVLHPF
jgi:hypothetical protein